MAPRASWKGHLRLSLVSCPVRLYPATTASGRISFNQLHKETHNRVNLKPVDPELGLVERSDLVKGYEYEDKKYVILSDEDFDSVRIESNHTMNIEAFVAADEVDVIYQDSPYYLAPDGKMAEETFIVLREAMREAGKLAIARVVLSSRERVVTIGARDGGMFVCTLRNPSEVRGTSAYFEGIPDSQPDTEMLQLAEQLITQKSTTFDPAQYEDRYEVALMEMIKNKVAGEAPVVAAEPSRGGNVINLMDALKQSLSQTKPPARSQSRKRPAAKTASTKSKSTGTAKGAAKPASGKTAGAKSGSTKASSAKAATGTTSRRRSPAKKSA
ncbi:MAG: Ku protein [Acuticoccus sp.]